MNSIFTRTSVRTYKDIPVEQEKVELLLKAAMAAPTAGNQREYEFVVVTDKDILQKLSKASPYAGSVAKAPLAIVLLVNPEGIPYEEYYQQDLGASAQNILLEATELGLGSVWLGIAPLEERMRAVAEILKIPAPKYPFAIIGIGYPKSVREAKDRYEENKVHYNQY